MTEGKNYVRIWILLKPQYRINPETPTIIHKNKYASARERDYFIRRYRNRIEELAQEGKIWQARIYDTAQAGPVHNFKAPIEYESTEN